MKKMIFPLLIMLMAFGLVPLLYADVGSFRQRDIAIDNAIGGMREGSRIVSPYTYGKKTQIPKVPGTQLHPGIDTRSAAGSSTTGTAGEVGGLGEGVSAGANEGIAGSGGSGAETPSGINTGGLGGGTSIEAEAPTGTDTGALAGGTAGESTGGSLIDVDASADLSSGSVDAGVGLDTSNTDKILDADISAGAGETGEMSGSADITAEDITSDSALPEEITDSAISSQADISTEVDTSGGSIGSEADIGVEADVEGGSEGDDVASDPADGLPTSGI